MLLVIDVGNSHTVIGLYEGDDLRAHWRLATVGTRTEDELRILLTSLLREEGVAPETVTGCCISSVVPSLDRALQQVSRTTLGVDPVVVGPGVKTGLVIQVDNPKELGADRVVNAVAAVEEYGGPVIVIDFGTAITFDVLSDRAEYKGGAIVPGIQIAADALFRECAKLPRVDIAKPDSVIGRDTINHIRAGLTYGFADLVDGLIVRMSAEMDATPTVVATGGMARFIADLAKRIDHVDPLLTLKGLKAVFHKNERTSA